jgi:hypothetical protein
MTQGLSKLVSAALIGLLLLVSGAPCTSRVPLAHPVIVSLDPCRQGQAPAPQCAQLACKAFDLPAATIACPPLMAAALPFRPIAATASGRLVPPPLPPPRAPMI